MSARDEYLSTQVTTASPQKLQLLLIEAALRSVTRARQSWQAGQDGEATEAILRAQDILTELIARLDHSAQSPVVQQVAAVYLFIYRNLVEASYQRNEQKLADAIRILEIERETWRQASEQSAGSPAAGRAPVPPPHGFASSFSDGPDYSAAAGLSLEA